MSNWTDIAALDDIPRLGARVVKTYWCPDFDRVTRGCPVPVVPSSVVDPEVLPLSSEDETSSPHPIATPCAHSIAISS